MRPALAPDRQAGTRLPRAYLRGIEGRVGLGGLVKYKDGIPVRVQITGPKVE